MKKILLMVSLNLLLGNIASAAPDCADYWLRITQREEGNMANYGHKHRRHKYHKCRQEASKKAWNLCLEKGWERSVGWYEPQADNCASELR